jgi:pectate lyase
MGVCRTTWAVAAAVAVAASTATMAPRAQDRDLGLEVLGPNDGWAAFGAGTTGGSAAAPHQVYVVRDRAGLIAALNDGNVSSTAPGNPSHQPKIIYVEGIVDANVDDAGNPLACEDYYRGGYTLEAFLGAYDPAVWGTAPPSGPLEDARLASRAEQMRRVRIRVGSNTTIVGVGTDATLAGAWFDIRTTSGTRPRNIIIRNITFRDTYDCFPAWVPGDGWNAEYDSISIRNATNVWIDHNTFENRDTAVLDEHFGEPYEVHDGQVDITNDADLLTVSWNRFRENDKGGSLIGASDGATGDRGRLRVTLHHNFYENIGQRAPRARYGQIHVYNNHYRIANPNYSYTWGVGVESAIVAENNFFAVHTGAAPARFIRAFRSSTRPTGTIRVSGTYVNGILPQNRVDVLAAYNAANEPDLSSEVGWIPVLFDEVNGTPMVATVVPLKAGPMRW